MRPFIAKDISETQMILTNYVFFDKSNELGKVGFEEGSCNEDCIRKMEI